MNRYLVIDWKKDVIYSLGRVDIEFEENENQTSSISCIDKEDMLKELEEIIEDRRKIYGIEVDK
jgi:hypothetical protein